LLQLGLAEGGAGKMNILLVDDHRLVRRGLARLVKDFGGDVDPVETDTVTAALELPGPFDLVLLDMHLGSGPQGAAAVEAIKSRFESASIVVVSGDVNAALIKECIGAGACGYICKSASAEVAESAWRLVLAGGVYLPPELLMDDGGPNEADTQPDPSREGETKGPHGLSSRQLEVLQLLVRGRQNKEIARELRISEGTVKSHLAGILLALRVRNRTEAASRALALGIFDAPVTAKTP